MKIIIAGSRGITDYNMVERGMNMFRERCLSGVLPFGLTILSGCARGVDTLAIRWAENHNANLCKYPANWDKFGKSAGFKRNQQMANDADFLVTFWDGQSRGTKDMIAKATEKGIPVITLVAHKDSLVWYWKPNNRSGSSLGRIFSFLP